MLCACKSFQIMAIPRGKREPALRNTPPRQPKAWRRSYLIENHQGIHGAKQAGFGGSLRFALGCSDHERPVKVDCLEFTIFLHKLTGRLGEPVKAQAILQFIYLLEQCPFQFFVLHPIYAAFKDRLLNSLADALAGFGYAAQAAASLGCFGGYVVTNEDEHR